MKLKEDKGFTLVELMVVVVILGIIAAVALPIYASSQEKARKTSCLQNQKIIHSAAEEYKTVNGTYPENVQKLFVFLMYKSTTYTNKTSCASFWLKLCL